MSSQHRLLWHCGAWIGGSGCDKRFKAISKRGGEKLDFAVKETIEALPFIGSVVIKSLESCSKVLKVLGHQG